MDQYNLVLSGLGGQGVITIANILAVAAAKEKIPVTLFEGTGISQRGGGVFAFLRFGESYSPKIPVAMSDAILGLEISEIVTVLKYLKPRGEIWVSSGKIPAHSTKLYPDSYPRREAIEALVRLKTPHLHMIPADHLALEVGSAQTVNMIMLGVFTKAKPIVPKDSVTNAILETSTRFASINLNAFLRGYELIG